MKRAAPEPVFTYCARWRLAAILAALLSGCMFSPLAFAEASTYRLDPVHSQVLFFASHLGFSNSMGRFASVAGSFQFDPDDWSTARVDAVIDISSLYLGDAAWQKKMLSDEFFAAERFPSARFVGARLEPAGKGRGRLHGELTLRGVTRPLVLDVRVNRVGRHTYSFDYVAGFSATGRILRSEFGMKRLLPAVGDAVELRLEIEGIRASRKASPRSSSP